MIRSETARVPLDLAGPLPSGLVVLEASAGTGKTYSLAALVARAIAERGMLASELLMVTFTRAAAAELRERTRAKLHEAAAALSPTGVAPPHDAWLRAVADATPDERAARRANVLRALARFDDATITTIHGFCQQALAQVGLRAPMALGARFVGDPRSLVAEVCRDVLIPVLATDPFALDGPGRKSPLTLSWIEGTLFSAVMSVVNNPGSVLTPALDDLDPSDDAAEVAARWRTLVERAVDEVNRRRRTRGETGFDELITGLHAVVHGPHRDDVVGWLRERYSLVLIDEFQDTDPVQWEIFSEAFRSEPHPVDVVVVGDPKQAIYRFRGADVRAYLAAVAQAGERRTLATNRRSDPALLEGLEALLRGATFGDAAIEFVPVSAPEGTPLRRLTGPAAGAPVELRWVSPTRDIVDRSGYVDTNGAFRLVLADLCHHVVSLTSGGATITGDDNTARPVEPADIAVLVRSHDDGARVGQALSAAGIPHVLTGATDVFEGQACDDWATLLRALAAPGHLGRVRACALGPFFGVTPLTVACDDAATAEVQMRLRQWADDLQRAGVAGFYAGIRSNSGMVERVLSAPGGERRLTDLDHIAELLHVANGDAIASAGRLADTLAQLAADKDADVDERKRRIDSDAAAVQVTTVHASKGLEFPIVLLPMLAKGSGGGPNGALVYHDGGRRTLDVAASIDWRADGPPPSTQAERKAAADADEAGDEMRLLYVALTRARHQVVAWWATRTGIGSSPLARVLLNRRGDRCDTSSAVLAKEMPKTAEQLAERFGRLDGLGGGNVACHPVQPRTTPAVYVPPPSADEPELTLAAWQRGSLVDPAWRHWSFTRIAGAAAPRPTETPLPPFGGEDEAQAGDDEPVVVSAPADAPLLSVPGGVDFGVMAHAVLEEVDPGPATVTEIADAVTRHCARLGLGISRGVDPAAVAEGLWRATRTPLGPMFDETRLCDVAASDRLVELTFDMPLHAAVGVFPAAAIGAVLADHLPSGAPLRPYAEQLAASLRGLDLGGFLQGSIDAVLRIRPAGTGSERYVVVDYKTNRLAGQADADPLAAYRPERLAEAMAHHDYPLQALLYSVALHRFLRWRLPHYDPATHLGGIGYLFLRAMVGEGTPRAGDEPYGVFAWRPSPALIADLDDLLAGGSA